VIIPKISKAKLTFFQELNELKEVFKMAQKKDRKDYFKKYNKSEIGRARSKAYSNSEKGIKRAIKCLQKKLKILKEKS